MTREWEQRDLEQYARDPRSEALETLRQVVLHAARSQLSGRRQAGERHGVHLDPRERAWDRILRAQESGEIIHAMVTEAVRGSGRGSGRAGLCTPPPTWAWAARRT